MSLKEKKTRLLTLTNQAKALYAELEAKGDKANGEDRTQLETLIADGQKLRQEIDTEEGLADLDAYTTGAGGERRAVESAGRRGRKTLGQRVIESEQYKAVHGRASLKGEMAPVEIKALNEETTTIQEVILVDSAREPDIVGLPQRPTSLLQLINIQPTSSAAVEYVRHITRTNNAAVMPEWSGGDTATPTASEFGFELDTALVKLIKAWVPATRQILDDAPRMRGYVDTDLTQQILIELENQVIGGDGVGDNFTGIINTSSTQFRQMDPTGAQMAGRGQTQADTRLDTLRRALTDIRLSFYNPDAIALNPVDAEALELTKTTFGQYIMLYDPVAQRVWRVPVVESQALDAGTSVVGAWKQGATLWDRQEAAVETGQPYGYFLQHVWAIMAWLRAAFAVTRPLAFEIVLLTDDPTS